jgi:hypothetical protein
VTFIHSCATLKHDEIERLQIQDELPVLAEVVKEEFKFTREWSCAYSVLLRMVSANRNTGSRRRGANQAPGCFFF